MNKTELIAVMAERAETTQIDAEILLNAFIEIVAETLGEKEEKVVITGFGTFEVRDRAERKGKNPRTGEVITIPAQKTPAFRAGKFLKDSVKR